jgi:hypothetical protein
VQNGGGKDDYRARHVWDHRGDQANRHKDNRKYPPKQRHKAIERELLCLNNGKACF